MLKVLATLGMTAAVALAAPAEDKVDYLPGMATFDFGLYSGYIDVNTDKRLHYMFAESQGNASTDPLVIWFNGGPGCSSMLGFVQEHGPYVMENGGDSFHKNDYSWNREANMLYIESPAGVGFSYCGVAGGCAYDDDQSAADNLAAVLNWYKKFPEYQQHELYISGESYAGIYVPYLANQIHDYNVNNTQNADVFKPNLKGFMVGNGVTNWKYDTTPAYLEMAYWHGLYDSDLYEAFKDNKCDFSFA